jgi:hypothetical protein
MTEKRQTSQGYIIRILQHFVTKLRNITNFVMLIQADEIFVQTCLDQNFTQKGKGLLTMTMWHFAPTILGASLQGHDLCGHAREPFSNST